MKVRRDFVTNSSSSSFIISKDHVTYDRLQEILLEIANKEAEYDEDENYEKYEDISYRYEIIEGTKDDPYEDWEYDKKYDNHFIVDNNCICRYNWDAIEEILDKYNIPWKYGYCD